MKNWNKTIKLTTTFLEKFPETPKPLYLRAVSNFAIGQFDLAL